MARKTSKKTAETITAVQTAETSAVQTAETAPVTAQTEETMETQTTSAEPVAVSFPLTKGDASKNGKKIFYKNVALPRGIAFPVSLFANGAPDSITVSGVGFKTRSADEQAKAEARNEKRAAKGLKPKATPAERHAALLVRQAKFQAKLERANKAAAKLGAKLGIAMPNAPATDAPAETATATTEVAASAQ